MWAQCLSRLVGYPDLRQEAAGIELRRYTSIDRVGLDLGVGNRAHLLRVGDDHLLHVRSDHCRGRGSVARSLDHYNVVWRQLCGERQQQIATHVDAAKALELAALPCHRLTEAAMDIQSDDAHACSLLPGSVKDGSWRATRHLLIRARSASG